MKFSNFVYPKKMIFRKLIQTSMFVLFSFSSLANADQDGDGVPDSQDNCIEVSNSDQLNTDGDQYGNLCDADFDNSGFVNLDDFDIFVSHFGTDNQHANFDGSGFVNLDDFDIFVSLFGKAPGPAGEGNSSLSKKEAARFLTQTTFGPTIQSIDDLVAQGSYENWLEDQFEEPMSSQFDALENLWV